MIKLDEATKEFGQGSTTFTAVKGATFDVADGEFVCLVGPSGCGKTTMLRMMAGLLPVTSGSIQINGCPVKGPQATVGMVFQKPVLLPWRTALENVLLPIEVKRRVTDDDRARAVETLASVGLAGFETSYPFELSGGMQQRVSISRALIHDPQILLMDEPFGALDALTREGLNVEINRLWRATHKTIVLITHSISEAVFLAERVVVMGTRPGRVVDVIDIDLPLEREAHLMDTPGFAASTGRVREYFEREARAS